MEFYYAYSIMPILYKFDNFCNSYFFKIWLFSLSFKTSAIWPQHNFQTKIPSELYLNQIN